MKFSHQLIRSILRILHCLGAFFGLFVFIYELFIQRNILYSICYACYLISTGAIIYLLFARKRPNSRFAYGAFFSMIFVTVLFFLSDIYESVTIVSQITKELIGHIEQNKDISPSVKAIIEVSKCCSINDEKHTKENFESFQIKYPDTCGEIEFDDAKPCLPFIRNQRSLMIFIDCITIIVRVLALLLLWKYIKDEYNSNNNDEPMNSSRIDGEYSTGNVVA
ncbi:unnamed protein product [Rotaria sp. Silwood2]|nr:unnamed protein product [Rotaria sp. Silwood2]CAF2880693.1 unnamed protein product [Rotaria sp. Silwood2]CAF3043077.1 unnamed protein product [Rotaria sp. Silwood2]CAF3162770.1 unnamed protein product [Rotaria sp. Silwood2]CAF4107970.1 unnamed protein product [Rotaria sp. Silwood2]